MHLKGSKENEKGKKKTRALWEKLTIKICKNKNREKKKFYQRDKMNSIRFRVAVRPMRIEMKINLSDKAEISFVNDLRLMNFTKQNTNNNEKKNWIWNDLTMKNVDDTLCVPLPKKQGTDKRQKTVQSKAYHIIFWCEIIMMADDDRYSNMQNV